MVRSVKLLPKPWLWVPFTAQNLSFLWQSRGLLDPAVVAKKSLLEQFGWRGVLVGVFTQSFKHFQATAIKSEWRPQTARLKVC